MKLLKFSQILMAKQLKQYFGMTKEQTSDNNNTKQQNSLILLIKKIQQTIQKEKITMKQNLQNIKPIVKQNIINFKEKKQNIENSKFIGQVKKILDKKKSKIQEHFGILEQKETNLLYKSKIHSKRQQSKNKINDLNIKISANKIKLQKRIKKSEDKTDDKTQIQMLKKEFEYLQSNSEGQDDTITQKNNSKFPKRQDIPPLIETPFEDIQRLSNNFFYSKQKMSVILQKRRRIKKLKSFSYTNQGRNWNTLSRQICLNDILINTRPYSSSINDETQHKKSNQGNYLNFTNYVQNYHHRKKQNHTKFNIHRSLQKNKTNHREDLSSTFHSAQIRSCEPFKNNFIQENQLKCKDRYPKIL